MQSMNQMVSYTVGALIEGDPTQITIGTAYRPMQLESARFGHNLGTIGCFRAFWAIREMSLSR